MSAGDVKVELAYELKSVIREETGTEGIIFFFVVGERST
jgi:hypothetical protein